MTNADKIRGMTDEQLAKWLDIFDMDICENGPLGDNAYCEEELCGEQWQKWVKQERAIRDMKAVAKPRRTASRIIERSKARIGAIIEREFVRA